MMLGLLPPSSKRDALEIRLCGRGHDEAAYFRGPGEGDLVHIHVAGDGSAGGGAESGQDVDHALRVTCFHK